MARIFLGDRELGEELALDGALSHHLGRVLRLKTGDEVVAVAAGCEWRLLLGDWVGAGKQAHLRLQVVARRPLWSEPRHAVHLVQGWPKGEHADFVLTAGTQVGIAGFWPALTRRSVAQPKGDAGAARQAALVREAAALAGRGALPAVAPAQPLMKALQAARGAVGEGAPVAGLSAAGGKDLPSFAAAVLPQPGCVLLVGPEGGWEEEELAQLRECGAEEVSLGPLTWRSGLAGVVAAGALLSMVGDGQAVVPPAWEPLGRGPGGA